jgi:hypothetical protein
MVSIADHTFHMLSRHMGSSEEGDFPLYPDPTQNMFPPQPFFNVQDFELENNLYNFPRTHAPYPATGFNSNTMYTDTTPSAPSYALESPELRAGAPSNYSTASGPSATSSAMGSPHSIHGHIASVPEWPSHGLGLNPSIVRFDSFGHNGNEYNFPSSGMEEFALDFDPAKPDGFVGECKTISRSARGSLHGSASSNPKSLSSSNFVSSPGAVNVKAEHNRSPVTSRSMASPVTPLSAKTRASREDCTISPVSTLSQSPISSRRPSQGFMPPYFSPSSAAQDMQSFPNSAVSQASCISESPSSPFANYLQSSFFSQSSGSFVLPLESSCWFPLSIQRRLLLGKIRWNIC